MILPSGLTALRWYDGSQTAYSDLAQAVPAVAPLGFVRSIPQPSPLSGSWTAPSDPERPTRTAIGAVACEPIALDYPTHGAQSLTDPGGATVLSNSVTLAFSFRPFKLNNGPRNVIFSCGRIGFELGGSGVAVRYNNAASWTPGVVLGKDLGVNHDGNSGEGNLVCGVISYHSTGIDLYLDEEGTVYNPASLVAAQTLIGLGPFSIGFPGGTAGNAIIAQAVVIDGYNPTRVAELITALKAAGCPPMFPTAQPLVSVIGDSIPVPFAASTPLGWPYRMLANLRAGAYPDVQLLNTSISGSGVAPLTGTDSTQVATTVAHLSNARAKQVVILEQVTNSIVGDPSNAGVDATVAATFAAADYFRAHGAKVVIATCLDRSGLLGSNTLAAVRAGIARYNAAMRANALSHCDAIADVAAIVALQDSTNLVNYSDGVHLTDVGHGLAEVVFRAAVYSQLSAVPFRQFKMQARSSSDNRLRTWSNSSPDRAGIGYLAAGFPGTPLDIVIASKPQNRT